MDQNPYRSCLGFKGPDRHLKTSNLCSSSSTSLTNSYMLYYKTLSTFLWPNTPLTSLIHNLTQAMSRYSATWPDIISTLYLFKQLWMSLLHQLSNPSNGQIITNNFFIFANNKAYTPHHSRPTSMLTIRAYSIQSWCKFFQFFLVLWFYKYAIRYYNLLRFLKPIWGRVCCLFTIFLNASSIVWILKFSFDTIICWKFEMNEKKTIQSFKSL